MIRNLLCHIWPVKGRGVWQWNVNQLLRRMDQFNGQRIVSVVTDKTTDTLKTVKAAFKGTVTNFIHNENNPVLGESLSFYELMHRVNNIDPRQITFYCHGKGVKYQTDAQPMVRPWTRVMYSNMLDYQGLIEDSLKKYAIVGTFKKHGNSFGGLTPSWHYAGTFFWFNNKEIFSSPDWHRIPYAWWGVEAWPGIICPDKAADSLFMNKAAPDMHLYQKSTWTKTVYPAWKEWQIRHANLHRLQSYKELKDSLQSRRIIVSGPQRSGTMIAAKIIAYDRKIKFFNETNFDTHDFNAFQKFIRVTPEFVVQAPTMSAYLHQVSNCEVVFMRRNLPDILRSQKRIDWNQFEELERDRYFDHSHDPIAIVKTRAWELFQRIALSESAFDLDYESLRSHKLWVDKEGRTNFADRQTYPSN